MKLVPTKAKMVLAYGCPFVGLLILNAFLSWPREISHSILLVVLACVLGWLGRCFFSQKEGRLCRYAYAFGFFLMLAQIIGAKLDASGTIADTGNTAGSLLALLLSALLLAPAGAGLFVELNCWIQKMQQRTAQKHKLSPSMVFWIAFAFMMLSWLPALLAYWPGVISYDIQRQIAQVQTGNYNDHNPIAHTLIIGVFYQLGNWIKSPNTAFALYSIFQMTVSALAMAFVLSFLWRINCPRWFCLCLLALFCFAPFFQLLVISTTKDVLFTDALVVWAVLMVDGILHPERRKKRSWNVGWILSAMMASLMRTNGIAAIVAVLIGGFFLLRKDRKLRTRILCLTLSALVGYLGIHTALVKTLDAKSGPFHEVLSVPIQQICRLLEILPYEEERYEIYHWIPDADLYQPALTDYVKHTADIQPSDLPAFLSLWAKLGIKHPIVYIDAFCFLTKGYWQIDDLSHATFRGELLEYHEGYLGTIFRNCGGLTPQSKWPALYDWYEQMYSVNKYLEIPFLSVITGLALWCWLLTALMLLSLYLRRREVALPFIMCWFMLLLLFMGPCCIVRYIFPFICIVPLGLGTLISPWGERKELSKMTW
ncbi:MAG: DUF6020 family protein [Clostridia bacterium]|nr:DUF6020 family protein [Clostridia bacterium]